MIVAAIERPATSPGEDIALALDAASTRVLRATASTTSRAKGAQLSSAEMVDYSASLCDQYPIVSIEDGMAEDDWEGWRCSPSGSASRIQLVGDDLFVTNVERLGTGHRRRASATPS